MAAAIVILRTRGLPRWLGWMAAQPTGDAMIAPDIRFRSAQEGTLDLSCSGNIRPARGPDPQRLRGGSRSPDRRAIRLRGVPPAVPTRPRIRMPASLRKRVSIHGPLRSRHSAAPVDPWFVVSSIGSAFLIFPPKLNPDFFPTAIQREPANCRLVLCGLDHTVFHFAQVPFLLALAFFGYRARRGTPDVSRTPE